MTNNRKQRILEKLADEVSERGWSEASKHPGKIVTVHDPIRRPRLSRGMFASKQLQVSHKKTLADKRKDAIRRAPSGKRFKLPNK
jgi:hypothetical protein